MSRLLARLVVVEQHARELVQQIDAYARGQIPPEWDEHIPAEDYLLEAIRLLQFGIRGCEYVCAERPLVDFKEVVSDAHFDVAYLLERKLLARVFQLICSRATRKLVLAGLSNASYAAQRRVLRINPLVSAELGRAARLSPRPEKLHVLCAAT